ncbi:helix-turn-helix domain-containing protein [Streptomyces sp. NPDC058442]|uniref:helix-turn-helix domain-containing protein n=1 Tax=Streptomyces sp. NPDC058442 TaxID=3346503 RepID=UPI003666BA95
MSTITWAQANPLFAGVAAILLLAVLVLLLRPLRKTPAAVAVASFAAMACTAYSADTSWRFAKNELGMASDIERAAMFAAAELALFACALMARQNLRAHGVPGVPGVLVWVITGVQVIPAYSESGFVGGTVRAVVGPVLAALLWHLAMGIELRHAKPDAASQSLPALIARELRERLLSRLGLATRDRTAEQITRDRWTVKAVGLAARLADMEPGARGRARITRRLSVAVGKAQAGASEEQRTKLLELLAARRHAESLATIDLPSPWQDAPEDVQDAPASPSVPPFPTPVPPGARLLPIVARPTPPPPTEQDAQDAPQDAEDAQDAPAPEPPLMTSNDVAEHYGIQPSTVRSWVAAGRIPVHSKDARGHNLFHPDDLPVFQVGVPV